MAWIRSYGKSRLSLTMFPKNRKSLQKGRWGMDSRESFRKSWFLNLLVLFFAISCSTESTFDSEQGSDEPTAPETIVVKKNLTRVQVKGIPRIEYLRHTFYSPNGTFHYESDGEHYIFYPGTVFWDENKPKSINDIQPAPSITLKKINGVWQYWKTSHDVSMWGPRNYKITDQYIVLGDGNEINEYPMNWKGNIFFGERLPQGEIRWIKVNNDEHMAYYHGCSGGDLTGDGLIDVGGAPGWYSVLKIFTQNPDGSFSNNDSLLNSSDYWIPFTLEFENIMGDKRAEIITASYHANELDLNQSNNVMVYTFHKDSGKFELHFVSSEPLAFYSVGMGATSIKVSDFDNDGIKDLAIAREREEIDGHVSHSFEIWKGSGDGAFKAHWATPIWNANQLQFREFCVFDVNHDGLSDIVLRPFHYGSYYRNNPVWWDVSSCNGIKLNYLIWINQGDGTFKHYERKELKIEGILVDSVYPYMSDGDLHFVGTFVGDSDMLYKLDAINLTTYDIQVRLSD